MQAQVHPGRPENLAQLFFVRVPCRRRLHPGGYFGQVVAKNGRIEQRDVRTGISDRLRVQILEGLQEGDHLLIGPADGSGG